MTGNDRRSGPSEKDLRRFWDKIEPEPNSGCWLWTGTVNERGYGLAWFDGDERRAHRVSWELAHGPIPKGTGYHGTCVCHRCDNTYCVNPSHLFLGSHKDNALDMFRKGRGHTPHPQGEAHCNAKLTAAQVREIRAKNSAGTAQRVLAREFGVSRSTIFDVIRRRQWAHV